VLPIKAEAASGAASRRRVRIVTFQKKLELSCGWFESMNQRSSVEGWLSPWWLRVVLGWGIGMWLVSFRLKAMDEPDAFDEDGNFFPLP